MTFGDVLLCFVPLFVAMDAIGAVPVYLALTDGLSAKERGRVTRQSLVTALVVGAVFLAAGRLLRVLGRAGTKGLSKVTALILAAIAVMMIRVGVQSVLAGPP